MKLPALITLETLATFRSSMSLSLALARAHRSSSQIELRPHSCRSFRIDFRPWNLVARVSISAVEDLLNGTVHRDVADRLGVPAGYLEDYVVRGSASDSLAALLGFNMSAAEALGRDLGKEGRAVVTRGMELEGEQHENFSRSI